VPRLLMTVPEAAETLYGPSPNSGHSWSPRSSTGCSRSSTSRPTPGARRGELLNLRWKDIDLDGKKITITGSTAVIGGERVNGTTKSGRTRVVSIDEETVAVLRQRKADQAAERLKAGDSWRGTKDGYVFTTGWGEPIYPDTVTSLMTKLIRANKQLAHARLHDLRTYTPRRCYSLASRSTSSRLAWGTQTQPSLFAYTPM
jgi:integrase